MSIEAQFRRGIADLDRTLQAGRMQQVCQHYRRTDEVDPETGRPVLLPPLPVRAYVGEQLSEHVGGDGNTIPGGVRLVVTDRRAAELIRRDDAIQLVDESEPRTVLDVRAPRSEGGRLMATVTLL